MGSETPFSVSVVIPAYNEEARIGAAIESARAQTEAPAEIVVVDDGSRDLTSDVARNLGAYVVRKTNGGLSSARNAGIRAAHSTWIAFLDADDRWRPEKLALCRRASAASPAVNLMFTDYAVVERGTSRGPELHAHSRYRRVGRRALGGDAVLVEGQPLARMLAAENILLASTVLVRRSFVVEHGLFFDETLPSTEDYHVSEDIEWYLRALKWSDAIVVERVLAEYHRRSGSISEKPGRLRIGDVKLGERVAKTPGRYATGAAEAFREHRRYQQRHAAVYYLKELDFARARAILRDAQSERFRAKDMVLGILAAWADKPLGRRAASIARLTWRRAIKPTLKTLASPFT